MNSKVVANDPEYTITHTCSHTVTKVIPEGTSYKRKREANCLSTRPCYDCLRAVRFPTAKEVLSARV